MIELEPDQFAAVLPLFETLHEIVPVAAVIEGYNPGRIFVDRDPQPTCAFLWMKTGYLYLAGDPTNERFIRDLHNLLFTRLLPEDRVRGETNFILFLATGNWGSQVKTILKGRAPIPIYRRTFSYTPACLERSAGWQERLPEGYRVVAVDRALIESHAFELERVILVGWESVGRYLEQSFGFAALRGEQIASLCLALMRTHDAAEIDIATHEAHRRRGLAAGVVSAFIEESRRRGLDPHWECFWDNLPSSNLAEKMGFLIRTDRPVFYWEEPA